MFIVPTYILMAVASEIVHDRWTLLYVCGVWFVGKRFVWKWIEIFWNSIKSNSFLVVCYILLLYTHEENYNSIENSWKMLCNTSKIANDDVVVMQWYEFYATFKKKHAKPRNVSTLLLFWSLNFYFLIKKK